MLIIEDTTFDEQRMMIYNRIDNRNKMVKSAIFFYLVGCGILSFNIYQSKCYTSTFADLDK